MKSGIKSTTLDPSKREQLSRLLSNPSLKCNLFIRSQLTITPFKSQLVDSETQTPKTCDDIVVGEGDHGTFENIHESYTCACPICGDSFNSSRYLRDHIKTHGSRRKTKRCIRCGSHVNPASHHLC